CRFDAAVMNPPYVGTRADAAILALNETARCGDLYAWFVEAAVRLTGQTGSVGTVVPLSLMFAGEKRTLRRVLLNERADARLSSFDNTPDSLFGAPGQPLNRQRATVVILSKPATRCTIRTTDHLRWAREERPRLFASLRYA